MSRYKDLRRFGANSAPRRARGQSVVELALRASQGFAITTISSGAPRRITRSACSGWCRASVLRQAARDLNTTTYGAAVAGPMRPCRRGRVDRATFSDLQNGRSATSPPSSPSSVAADLRRRSRRAGRRPLQTGQRPWCAAGLRRLISAGLFPQRFSQEAGGEVYGSTGQMSPSNRR